jgi:hypothetical protein
MILPNGILPFFYTSAIADDPKYSDDSCSRTPNLWK